MKWANPLVALTSALVLVIEIVAARMVAPYVGVTLETFSAVIGCVLAAIALGNWVGGRLADSLSPHRVIAAACVLGGVAAGLAPGIVHRLGPGLAGDEPVRALALTVLAFALPCAALSAVSPVVVRHLGADTTRLGRVAGNVSAFATVGALLGNFGAGFWLVGRFGSTAILLGAGAVAVGVGATIGTNAIVRRKVVLVGVTATSAVAVVGMGSLADARTPCTIETEYVCLSIDEVAPGEFHVRSNIYSSSYTVVDDPTTLRLPYARDVAAALELAAPGADHVVSIGGGGETLIRYLAATRPQASQTVIEIDDSLARSVRDRLGPFANDDRVETVVGDARLVIDAWDAAPADVVIGDAFSGLSVPWHLTTRQFLSSIERSLTSQGIYVMNIVDAGNYDLARAELATLQTVFDDVVVLARGAVFEPDGPNTNLVVIVGAELPDASDFEVAARNQGSSSVAISGPALDAFVAGAEILTDDRAPTDQLVDVGR